jgi:hypothetical protein
MIATCNYIDREMVKEQIMQQILEMPKAMREEADTERIADREYMKQMMAKMESWRENIQAETEAIGAEMKAIQAKTKAM